MTTGTTVDVGVTLPPALEAAATADAEVIIRVETDLRDLMHGLGINRRPVVELTASPWAWLVTVDGRPCAVPSMTVRHASAYIRGSPLAPPEHGGTESECAPLAEGEGDDPERLAELLSLVCRSALVCEAGLWAVDTTLQPLLDLGISIADVPADLTHDHPDAIEEVIAEHARSSIDIFIDPAYLRDLTSETDRSDLFPFMRDGLFVELGLPLPPLRFRFDSELRPGGFAFGVQDVRTIPRIGLALGTILVNDTPERLRLLGVDAQATTNPASNRYLCGVTSIDHKPMLITAGLTTWDPLEYLILTLAGAIRRQARCLVTNEVTTRLIDSISHAYPALTDAVREVIPNGVITRVLRDLLTDRLSIRNLRRILELLPRYETDEDVQRRCDRVTYVRSGLGDAIAHAHIRSRNTLVVDLLDPALEHAFRGNADLVETRTGDDEAIRSIRAAMSKELSRIPQAAFVPAILVEDDCRVAVRAALRPQFPDILVLGYRDIPPTTNIQPVARIGSS